MLLDIAATRQSDVCRIKRSTREFNALEIAMSDQNLKQNVLDKITWEPIINPARISVCGRDNVVTLTGHVRTYGEKWAAERKAFLQDWVNAYVAWILKMQPDKVAVKTSA